MAVDDTPERTLRLHIVPQRVVGIERGSVAGVPGSASALHTTGCHSYMKIAQPSGASSLPIACAAAGIAAVAFTATATTSCGGSVDGLSVATAGFARSSAPPDRSVSPRVRIACNCAPRATIETSSAFAATSLHHDIAADRTDTEIQTFMQTPLRIAGVDRHRMCGRHHSFFPAAHAKLIVDMCCPLRILPRLAVSTAMS